MAFGRKENLGRSALAALAALSLSSEASAQQAPGRSMSQSEFEATLPPEEIAARRAYARRSQSDPEAIALQARADRGREEGTAYCNKLKERVRKEGYAAVERDIGGQGMMECDL